MKCAWQTYINLLPLWMREDVDRLGRDGLQELRLRIGRPPELRMKCNSKNLNREVTSEDLSYCVNAASRYSPWSVASMSQGFITALGGHRLGICGEVTVQDGRMKTVAHVTSLCIRVARDFPGIGLPAANLKGSTLVIGSPGSGKTRTLSYKLAYLADFFSKSRKLHIAITYKNRAAHNTSYKGYPSSASLWQGCRYAAVDGDRAQAFA